MKKIVLIDCHTLFRVSMKSFLNSLEDFEVALDVDSPAQIPSGFDTLNTKLVIVDPKGLTIEVFNNLQERFICSRFILLTNDISAPNVVTYMHEGIVGFFSKDDCPVHIKSSIINICEFAGSLEVQLGQRVRDSLIKDVRKKGRRKIKFSNRELQVLELVCKEKTNAEISDILGLSVRTIESHRRRMIDKSDCKSIIGVILSAIELKSLNFNFTMTQDGNSQFEATA